jgi:MoaA/NifB/PqqE/SkfB family radical SAM enzyme
MNLLKLPGLEIDLEQNELLELKARGSLSKIALPFINKINDRLKREKPAVVEKDKVIMSTWLPPIPSSPFNRILMAELSIVLGKYVPETLSLEITRQCRCKCEHCVVSEGEGELSLEQIKNIIDQALEMGVSIVTFTEGDPLLRKEIFELVKYVDKQKAIVNLFTPGTELDIAKAQKLKEAGLHNLLISIYSVDPEKHDRVRRLEGAHSMAIAAIKTALKVGLLVTMATHISPDRLQELPKLYELARELGVHEFSVWEAIPGRELKQTLSNAQRAEILEMYHRVNSSRAGPRMFSNTYFEGEMLGCLAGRRWMHVCISGDVKPCPYFIFSFGNVLEKPLSEIWSDMRKLEIFKQKTKNCMMLDPEFRRYIEKIPNGALLPYPFTKIFC